MIALILACCIAMPADVSVDTEKLTLGALMALPASDARAVIALGNAPQPGLARRIQRYEIVNKLVAAGLRVDDLSLPESVLVRRKSQSLDADAVRQAVEAAFARQYPEAAVNIISVDVPTVDVATGLPELSASIPTGVDASGPIFVVLDIKSTGSARRVFVRTVAEVLRPQPVLRSPIAAHSAVRKEDLEWKVVQQGKGVPIKSPDGLEGFAAKRDLKPGEILTEELLYSPLLVRKGDPVTVKATSGGITIAVTMRAKAQARYGETISVEHLTGAGTATARVIGPGLLEALQGVK